MSNELQITSRLYGSKGGVIKDTGTVTKTADLTGTKSIDNVQAVGTSPEAVLLGDITSPGFVQFRNLDPTNFVELALDVGMTNKIAKMLPGEPAGPFRAASATMYLQADTAACEVQVTAFEA